MGRRAPAARAIERSRSTRAPLRDARRRHGARECRRPCGSACADRFKEALQLATTNRMLQFSDRFRFDLAHALTRDLEDLSDLLERVRVAVAEAVAQLDDLALAVRQRVEDALELLLEHLVRRGVDRRLRASILDEIPEEAVVRLADRPIERDRMLRDLDDLAGLLLADPELLRDLLDRRLAAILLDELLGGVPHLAHRLDHVDGDADRPRLIRDRAGDRLANPPRRVGRELVAPAVLVLLDRLHEAGVPLRDEVEERQP